MTQICSIRKWIYANCEMNESDWVIEFCSIMWLCQVSDGSETTANPQCFDSLITGPPSMTCSKVHRIKLICKSRRIAAICHRLWIRIRLHKLHRFRITHSKEGMNAFAERQFSIVCRVPSDQWKMWWAVCRTNRNSSSFNYIQRWKTS